MPSSLTLNSQLSILIVRQQVTSFIISTLYHAIQFNPPSALRARNFKNNQPVCALLRRLVQLPLSSFPIYAQPSLLQHLESPSLQLRQISTCVNPTIFRPIGIRQSRFLSAPRHSSAPSPYCATEHSRARPWRSFLEQIPSAAAYTTLL